MSNIQYFLKYLPCLLACAFLADGHSIQFFRFSSQFLAKYQRIRNSFAIEKFDVFPKAQQEMIIDLSCSGTSKEMFEKDNNIVNNGLIYNKQSLEILLSFLTL